MKQYKFEFEIWMSPDRFGYDVRIACREGMNGDLHVAQPVVMRKYEQGDIAAPCLHVDKDDLQKLMDVLWGQGFRPANCATGEGRVEAMQQQIYDLRLARDLMHEIIRHSPIFPPRQEVEISLGAPRQRVEESFLAEIGGKQGPHDAKQ